MLRRIFLERSAGFLGLMALPLTACQERTDGILQDSNSSTINQSPTPISNMKLESTAFEADGLIPAKYTCDGQDISPPLAWEEPPARTESFAFICDDPDAPLRTFVHWVLYDLPVDIRQLPEGVPGEPMLSGGGVQGKSDFDKLGYGGPCPPSGVHRYFFKVYALSRQLGLKPGATKAQLQAAMEGYILGSSELIGRYSRQR
ncbi:YbhB/YbcL family Raf kinase inhibitor-like protein [Lyngbya aestuarii]|uniref:YbhB/YbcL family Raf kinase inhibitor-like protein n=1 Tax=Lyngbya aestuarii TaxID=118322 RepID=UPI00403DB7EF